jgi:hypothetical protein
LVRRPVARAELAEQMQIADEILASLLHASAPLDRNAC